MAFQECSSEVKEFRSVSDAVSKNFAEWPNFHRAGQFARSSTSIELPPRAKEARKSGINVRRYPATLWEGCAVNNE